jgi:hypothetical protein
MPLGIRDDGRLRRGPARRRHRRIRLWLHDPPPGYHRPRPRTSQKERQRTARQELVTMRVATVVLILTAAAFVAVIALVIATRG